jgi:hypothetical protein
MAYKFTNELLGKSLSYESYRNLINTLLAEGKTTGDNQETSMIEYTKMNVQRMSRIDKTTIVSEELKGFVKNKQHWVLITEGWCGDAANTVPVIAKMCEYSEKAVLHILLRDENPKVMNEYLTNGAKSVPVLIVLDENLKELFVWGPRPAELQQYVLDFKKQTVFDIDELKKNVQIWYFNNKTISTQKEIIELLKKQ